MEMMFIVLFRREKQSDVDARDEDQAFYAYRQDGKNSRLHTRQLPRGGLPTTMHLRILSTYVTYLQRMAERAKKVCQLL